MEKPNFSKSEQESQAKLGDYVNARLAGEEDDSRQGVFVKDNGDGTIEVQGVSELYHCEGPESVTVVPDKEVFFTHGAEEELAKRERQKLGL